MLLKEASPFEAFKQGALMLLDHLAKDSAQPQRNDDWFRRLQSSHASVGSGFGTGGAVNCAPHVINLHTTPLEVAGDSSWRELFTRVSRIAPHLWPSRYPKLQFIAVCTTSITTYYPNEPFPS
ncbi:hypothetical protein P692DRAFT_20884064 [Suillus brevipes Sb2]|nr:hypothetical protein P692DRAFT_20884064 [Suillus brevipes Sb2]